MGRFLAAALAAVLLATSAAQAGIPVSVSQAPPANDQANAVVRGSFGAGSTCATARSASDVSPDFLVWGGFNLLIYGSSGPNGSWTASVQLERSFDGGTTWIVAGVGGSGTQAVYATPNQDVSVTGNEPEKGVLYSLHCTAYTSGTINYRLSTTSAGAATWQP